MAGWLGFQLYRVALAEGLAARGFTDLREADWSLLRYLHHHGGASVNEIAHLHGVTKQAASQQVASLVKRGYAASEPAEHDARIRRVTLTDKGDVARRAAIDVADQIEAELTERAGPQALRGWRKVTDAMIDAYLDDAPEVVREAAQMSSTG
jgi:DNA-binding MarR family transcriptional regulator